MAREGQLTTDVVGACADQPDRYLGTAVDGMAVTVGDAMTALKQCWTKAIGESDVSPLVQAIEDLREVISDPAVMEGLTNLASLLVSIAGIAVQTVVKWATWLAAFGFAAAGARTDRRAGGNGPADKGSGPEHCRYRHEHHAGRVIHWP